MYTKVVESQPGESDVSKAIYYYFILSLAAIVRGITSLMRIGFMYYTCLGFDLASGYTSHYTEYCSGSSLQKD